MHLENSAENVVLQLACGYVSAPLHTFKTQELLRAGVASCSTRVSSDKQAFSHSAHQAEVPNGGATWDGAPKLYHLGRGDAIDLLDLTAPKRPPVPATRPTQDGGHPGGGEGSSSVGLIGAFYNSAQSMPYTALVAQGAVVASQLELAPGDALAIPVPLNHAFGMAGLLAAVQVIRQKGQIKVCARQGRTSLEAKSC
jgi:hypothetical protein